MARSHAKFYVRAWRDPDWRALTLPAQWLYWTLLTQPQLTLVGSLEVNVPKWATYAQDLTLVQVEDAMDELEEAGFVVIDDHTGEMLIRSFTKNDLDPGRLNVNLAKGLWGHWGSIESAHLRVLAVTGMPVDIWERVERHAPDDAKQTRRSARLEPDVRTERSDEQFEPPPSSLLPPVTSHQPDVASGLVSQPDPYHRTPEDQQEVLRGWEQVRAETGRARRSA